MVTTHYVSPLVDTEAKYNSFRSFLKTPRKSAATGGIPELKTILSGYSGLGLDFDHVCRVLSPIPLPHTQCAMLFMVPTFDTC